jgi:hypothetical protein
MVADSMPPITPVPMACWLPEPAPLEIARGRTPKMKASEVMMIGRRRMRTAFQGGVDQDMPFSYRSLANSTIRMAFLAARPMVVSRPTWK